MTAPPSLAPLAAAVRACTHCAPHLPLGPKPTFQVGTQARLMLCSQAPGTKAHIAGRPFADASGDRLREWLGIGSDTFYDPDKLAIFPMGLCYPGRDAKGGDKPPRPECAPLWRQRMLDALPRVELYLLVGSHAQRWHLRDQAKPTLRETVAAWRDYHPRFLPLPHPSWRNNGWLRANPWFEADVLPWLRGEVARLTA